MAIVVVTATRAPAEQLSSTAIGKSLETYGKTVRPKSHVFYSNTRPLSSCYNEAISAAKSDDVLVFVHDDVLITDFFWALAVMKGLKQFDIIGVAGNRRRLPKQPGWSIIDEDDTQDADEHLTGVVGHGVGYPCTVTVFGPVPAPCKLLDGVFLAVRKSTLEASGVCFDERFDFDFYDMDFCRQAEAKGLSMGTVPLGIIHESGGDYFTPRWKANYRRYLEKWHD